MGQRTNRERHLAQCQARNRAWNSAVKLLIEEHPDRYYELMASEGAKEDPQVIPRPRSRPTDAEVLEREIARLRRQLAWLEDGRE